MEGGKMEYNPLLAALAMTTLAGLATGLGGLLVLWVQPSEKMLGAALGFAAGVMLAISLSDLLPGALRYYEGQYSGLGAGCAAASLLLAGMALAGLLSALLPEDGELLSRMVAPPEAEKGGAAPGLTRARALHCGLAVGLAMLLHNLPEGILTLFHGMYDLRAGLRLSLAIALHNLPEGISVAAPLWYATRRRSLSAGVAFLSGLAEPIGALLAYGLLAPVLSEGLLNGMTLAAAGMMCWVSVAELLFGGFEIEKKGCTAAGFAVGVCGMTLGIALLS
jgi:ZIP family zinc transporter